MFRLESPEPLPIKESKGCADFLIKRMTLLETTIILHNNAVDLICVYSNPLSASTAK